MKVIVRVLAMFLAGAWVLGGSGSPATAAGEICPMGGAMVVAETGRDQALAWARARSKVGIIDAGATDWSVLTFSVADEGVAVYMTPGMTFFGVPGRGGETYPKNIEQAFGASFAKLRDAMAKTLADLVASGAVKVDAAEIPAIVAAAGIGVLEKGPGGWALTTRQCQPVDLPTSGL